MTLVNYKVELQIINNVGDKHMSYLKTILVALLCSFGTMSAQAALTGEMSSDITIGDDASFSNPYTGLGLAGEDWDLSMNLSNGDVVVEEAKYNIVLSDQLTVTFGKQAGPYGLAWGLHRPSNNQWVSAPREHVASEGIGVAANAYNIGIQALYGSDGFWAARASYDLFGHSVGFSVNSEDAQLVDASGDSSVLGISVATSFEYDLANDGAYWLRSSVTPGFVKDAFVLVGYNSDEEVSYGVGYNYSENCKLATELSAEGDTVIRISYSF
tara:strand:- start:2240 stop:3049 length:810 start_codon:yes stop_codon:yes gene_type:complete